MYENSSDRAQIRTGPQRKGLQDIDMNRENKEPLGTVIAR
jgi:hypothetical protein